jgi:hypothetical protein
METDRFDAMTARLAQALTRRRSLGLLAALGAATSLGSDAEAGKKKGKKKGKKGKKTPKPCGGACGACQTCVSGTCTQVIDGTACSGSGACFAGQCLTCTGGEVPVDGLCAKLCTVNADCGEDNVFCHTYYANNGPRYCMRGQNFDTTPDCPSGSSSECGAGRLCVNYTAPKCLVAA